MITTSISNIVLAVTFSTSFFGNPTKPIDLVNTKWISPVNDDCSEMLCFNSERTVIFKQCDDDWSFELGYKITDGKIEIEAYEKKNINPSSQLILFEDHGVLRQYETQVNSFPKVYVQIPGGKCE
jgi:hypothetical protein